MVSRTSSTVSTLRVRRADTSTGGRSFLTPPPNTQPTVPLLLRTLYQ